MIFVLNHFRSTAIADDTDLRAFNRDFADLADADVILKAWE
jgi:hypothetical protein